MPVNVINNNPTTGNRTTSTSNTPSLAFSATDFQKWNQTTSVVHLPAKLIGKDKIPKVRGEIVKAIGEKKVAAVQALSPTKYRIPFTSSSYRHERDVNGISFRGVTLTPHPACEEVTSVFVDRAPLQMPDSYLFELLAPYGRVLSIEHLKVKGFENVKSGTRRVSMVITNSIPSIIKISNIQLSFRYRGQPPFCFVCQEVGHTGRDCPKSRKAHRNTLNANLSPEDLRHTLNHVKEGDLRVKLNKSQNVSEAVPAGTAATSPPSLNTADMPNVHSNTHLNSRSNNNNTHPSGNNNNNVNNVHPERTITETNTSSSSPSSPTLTDNISKLKVFNIPANLDRKATSAAAVQSTASMPKSASSSCSAQSSHDLRATISTLKKVFEQPSEIDRTAESEAGPSFESLARETQSAAEQSTASVHTVASTTSTGFLVQLNGQVVTAKRPDAAVPQAESFDFSLKPARSLPSSSAATRSAWSDSYKQAVGIHLSGGCLDGNSVFDPLASEQNAGSESAATVAPIEPSEVAMSPSDPADNETSSLTQVSTPASFLSGAKDLPSPASSQGLFERLAVVAPVYSDPLVNSDPLDSDISFSSPTIKRISGLAGQDRLRSSC